jgi:hypothetical protein
MTKKIKVIATAKGLYNNRVYEVGDVFDVYPDVFTVKPKDQPDYKPSWFEEAIEQPVQVQYVAAPKAGKAKADDKNLDDLVS